MEDTFPIMPDGVYYWKDASWGRRPKAVSSRGAHHAPYRPPCHPATVVAFTASVKAVQVRKGSRNGLPQDGGAGRLAHDRDAGSGGLSRRAGQRLSRHRKPGRPALRAAPRRPPRVSSACSTRRLWPSPTTPATGNTSPPATSRKTTAPICFLMDYAHRHRIKIWGRAKVVEDAETIARLMPEGYAARAGARRSCSPSRPGTATATSIFRRKFDAADRRRHAGEAAGAHRRARGRENASLRGRGRAPVAADEVAYSVASLPVLE